MGQYIFHTGQAVQAWGGGGGGGMEFSIKLHTMKSGWSIEYIEGSHIIISKNKYCISFSEDRLCLSKQCRPQ